MSINTDNPQHLANVPWQRSMQQLQPPPPTDYPSSGAFTHLPVRRTITGGPALPHPSANKIFLRDLPGHCYSLPSVTLNFTIVEIFVFLPNWFKNKAICTRFMSNNLTAYVHFAILNEHRDLGLADEYMKDRARTSLTDEYRKTMRSIQPGWTKAKHVAALNFDMSSMALDGFVPDDVRSDGYRRPPSVPFHALMLGVKKVPEGVQAGDLTRALHFALQSQQEFMFPDDLPNILDHIGRTQITMAHTDRSIVRRYNDLKTAENTAKKPRTTHESNERSADNGVYAQSLARGADAETKLEEMPFATRTQTLHAQPPVRLLPGLGDQHSVQWPSPIEEATAGGQGASNRMRQAPVDFSGGDMEMEALLRQHLDQAVNEMATSPAKRSYSPHYRLRDCVEGNVSFDGSSLARAARFAQRPDQIGRAWCVEHVNWLVELLDAAQFESF